MDRKTLVTTGALAAVFLAGFAAHGLLTGPANAQAGGGVSISASSDGSKAWVVAGGQVRYCNLDSGGYVRCTG